MDTYSTEVESLETVANVTEELHYDLDGERPMAGFHCGTCLFVSHLWPINTKDNNYIINNAYTLPFKSLGSLEMRNVLVFERNSDFLSIKITSN